MTQASILYPIVFVFAAFMWIAAAAYFIVYLCPDDVFKDSMREVFADNPEKQNFLIEQKANAGVRTIYAICYALVSTGITSVLGGIN